MSKKPDKKGGGIAVFLLVFGWLTFILLCVIFYFYFFEDFKSVFNKSDTRKKNEMVTEYELNQYPEINELISTYYNGLSTCNQATLKSLVKDPSAFDDMSSYETKAQAITAYTNIQCYTVPGYYEGDYICYAICNLSLTGIQSRPLNINQFYISKNNDGYLIDNNIEDNDIIQFINTVHESENVQNLYKTVKDDVDRCALEDAGFAEYYNKVMSQ